MNRNHWVMVGIAVVSLAAGATGGYFFAEKRLREEYDQRSRRDVEEVKDYYRALYKTDEFETPAKAAEKLLPQEQESFSPPSSELMAAVEAVQRYSGEGENTDVEEVTNIFDGTPNGWDQAAEEAQRSDERPYIITQEEFLENSLDHEQMTMTYYEGDDTLADSTDDPVDNIEKLIGEANMTRFGHGSNDNNIVYIRNEAFEMDFEIVRSNGKFAREVLGFIEHSDRPKIRRFRQGYDE